MVDNFPGPYELRLEYDTTVIGNPTIFHTQRMNVDLTAVPSPGDSFNNINAKTRGGIATPDLAAVVDAWLTLIAPLFFTSTNFGIVELWKYTPLSYEAVFISSYNSAVDVGTAIVATGSSQQDIWTFRTTEGGIMRVNLMEATVAAFDKIAYPTGTAELDAVFDFITSSVNWMLARDTSYPFSALRFLRGQNEKLFRIRFR